MEETHDNRETQVTEIDRKTLTREYKQTPRPAGIFRVRNIALRRSLVGSSLNLPGIINRHRFQLQSGLHADRELQRHWNELGPQNFAFEVLDDLTLKKEPSYDPTDDLCALLEMWIEKLAASGESFYGRADKER